MGASCCDDKQEEIQQLGLKHRRVLQAVLIINLSLFLIEGAGGLLARSMALQADALDMLGDAFVYGVSLYAIGRSRSVGASVSLLKGGVMTLFGIFVLGQAIFRFLTPGLPEFQTMGWIGSLALVGNLTCALLLLRYRGDNINMRSTWLCSRNDVFANLGVLVAAAAVAVTQTKYPDLVVGVLIAGVVLYSAIQVIQEARGELRAASS